VALNQRRDELPLDLMDEKVGKQRILIGALSTLAVWLIGVPSALALGIIAAIGEFVPYLGPLLAAIPAILVALTKSPEAALWTRAPRAGAPAPLWLLTRAC
jgi:hypothetical protein